MKVSEHFQLQELVPQAAFTEMGEKAIELLHPDLIDSIEKLRVQLAVPLRVNNWNSGGTFQNRGWRPRNSKVGAKKSLHKEGKAVDFDSPGLPMIELFKLVWNNRDWIVKNTAFRIIESFTATPGWVHLAIGDQDETELKVITP
jgi:uncharacterized protein YcbK (DUF882 family)